MPCCYARQRLLQERRVGVSADPHLSNGGLAGLAARRSHANAGQVLDAVHSPIRGVERVVRVGNDAQALGVRRLGNRTEDLAFPVLAKGDNVGLAHDRAVFIPANLSALPLAPSPNEARW